MILGEPGPPRAAASPVQLTCPACKVILESSIFNQPELLPCGNCGSLLQVEAFPALFRRVAPGRDGDLVMEGESTCFYHPAKQAVRPCEGCGRFVCTLCDCELHGQHFCPACLEVGRKKGKIKKLEKSHTQYDSIALTLAVAAIVLPFTFLLTVLGFIAAPTALYIAIRYWNAPQGLIRRSKIRYILAIIFSTMAIAGWLFVLYSAFHSHATISGPTINTSFHLNG